VSTGTLAAVKKRLIVGITGATGAVYGIGVLKALKEVGGWESHLVLTDAGVLNVWHEHKMKRKEVERLADFAHHPKDIAATIASGSFVTEGMVIAPCSMKTLAGVAHAYADDLVSRAADVVLKERRRLVLVPRETPLNLAHLRNMVQVTEMGGIIMPPMPAFYAAPKSIDDLVNHTIGRILDLFNVSTGKVKRWKGMKSENSRPREGGDPV
jgi:polyprenyl P-hydroxybenzoate/phenylacrylic acid decarboxylase-like protein